MTNGSNNLGRIIKQQRVLSELTLQKLSAASGVSSSHLGRIERGERFPSAHILRKIAKPLGLGEGELLTLADYLSPSLPTGLALSDGRLDPYVVKVLSEEPVEVQRKVVAILVVLKSMARGITQQNSRSSTKQALF